MDRYYKICKNCGAKIRKRSIEEVEDRGSTAGSFTRLEMSDENISHPLPDTKGKRKTFDRPVTNFRWKPHLTHALLDYIVSLVEDGFRGNRAAAGARFITQHFELVVSEPNVYNHLRTWKNKWAKILNCKNLSGVGWDEENKMIVMGSDMYRTYIQVF